MRYNSFYVVFYINDFFSSIDSQEIFWAKYLGKNIYIYHITESFSVNSDNILCKQFLLNQGQSAFSLTFPCSIYKLERLVSG